MRRIDAPLSSEERRDEHEREPREEIRLTGDGVEDRVDLIGMRDVDADRMTRVKTIHDESPLDRG